MTRSSTTTTEGKSDFDDDAYSGGLGERLASAMRLKEGGGGGPPTSRRKDACVTFYSRKFYTNWGENVVVCGKSRAMGAYDPTKGAWMSCEHVPKKKKKIQIQKKRDPGDGRSLLAPEEERDGDDDDDDAAAAPRESDDDFDEEEEEEERVRRRRTGVDDD